ncbi:MAG: ABC transporter permease [Deltaproteobacteria bacterium]|jgi:peptide/nickel transport system permease protein|nr:ABC transporter permease [Deltaproteobacteria bacterium]
MVIALRTVRALTLIVGMSVLTFALMHFSPLDPITRYVSSDPRMSPEQIEKLKIRWGLDKGPVEQYFIWAGAMLRGDFGTSRLYRTPVSDIIKGRFLMSLALMGVSWVLSGVIGYGLGALAAFKRGKTSDKVIRWFSYVLVSTPAFWLALILMLVLAVWFHLFPVGLAAPAGVLDANVTFAQRLWHLALPVMTLSVIGIANVTLHTREKMVDILNSEYVLFAKARGESSWSVFWNHGFRNSVLPAITLQFAYFSELFGGSVLAEDVFSYPGLGNMLTVAGLGGDLPLFGAIVLISGVFVFLGNLVADIVCVIVDPRIRAL